MQTNDRPRITHDFAILAPVPILHLMSGLDVINPEGEVAFGTQLYEFFYNLEKEREKRKGDQVEVFIYASLTEENRPEVAWHGVYTRYLQARGKGRHPLGNLYRPESTRTDTREDALFWHVRRLCKLSNTIPLTTLSGYPKSSYSSRYLPKEPVLIQYPSAGPRLDY